MCGIWIVCGNVRSQLRHKTILQTCDNWDTDYNSYNWESEFMTIFVTWQSRVTVDSIRNSCDVLHICATGPFILSVLTHLLRPRCKGNSLNNVILGSKFYRLSYNWISHFSLHVLLVNLLRGTFWGSINTHIWNVNKEMPKNTSWTKRIKLFKSQWWSKEVSVL